MLTSDHLTTWIFSILQAEGRDRAFEWAMVRTEYIDPAKSLMVQKWIN